MTVPLSSTQPSSAGPGPAKDTTARRLARKLVGLPKPVLFGLCGAIGGLLGAIVLGELLWLLLSPAGVQPHVKLSLPASMPVYVGGKNHFLVKIGRQKFTGPVTVEAKGEVKGAPDNKVAARATIGAEEDQAEMDIEVSREVEAGEYELQVQGRGPSDEVGRGTVKLIVKAVPPSLGVTVSPRVALYQGGKSQFTVRVGRSNFAEPVTLRFKGVPLGVSLPEVVIPADRREAVVEVSAPADQAVGTQRLTVEAVSSAGAARLKHEADFALEILAPPVPKVDVVFVLDLTSSMQFAIDGVKDGIQSFVTHLENKKFDARFAMVCFRDIVDDKERPYLLDFDGNAFTKDFKAFRDKVRPLRASGGGDEPESSLQAVALAAKQSFRENAAKVLILITDAPPKDHPFENPRTVDDTIKIIENNKINQLHLVVREKDHGIYEKLQTGLKGSYFDITKVTGKDSFAGILPKLSGEISRLTKASLPPPPGETKPPALLTEKVADLPPATTVAAVQSTQTYEEKDRIPLLLAIGVWTMVIAGGIGLLIVVGQQLYVRQSWVSLSGGGLALGGGFLAGLAGGILGQLFFQFMPATTAWEAVGRILGWSLLGGLIGLGMTLSVPNLKWHRGLLGGLLGGFLGALAFQVISGIGSLPGRWIGAAILGLCIGLMVALAELAFRRWWLEIAFGPREVRTITLGAATVGIGGDENLASIFVPGALPVALRYYIQEDRVLCEDVATRQTTEVMPGEQRQIGKVTIKVCSAASARQSGYALQLSDGKGLRLGEGMPLTADDLRGLQPQGADGAVALVGQRPNDPRTLVLRNRSRQVWTIRKADGNVQTVEPGGGVELAVGVQINFGQVHGTLMPDQGEGS
jgi:hypothetical protein